jgi:hypothetical protein
VVRVVAVIRIGSRHLVQHPVVLRPHRDGLRIHAVAEVLHPPLRGRHGLMVVLLLDLGRAAVAAGLCDDLLYIFRADPRGVVADVDGIVIPVQVKLGDVRLLPQGPFDGTGAAQAVHATELERAASHGSMPIIGRCGILGVIVGHGGYPLLSTLRTPSLPTAEGGSTRVASRAPYLEHYPCDGRHHGQAPKERQPWLPA